MGLLTVVEDRPTPRCVYNARLYFTAAVASAASCMIGYDSAFIGTTLALASFRAEFRLNALPRAAQDRVSANIVSLYQAGAFFGSFLASPVGHFAGRRPGCLVSAAVFTVGAALMLGANGDRGLGLLYAGRVLAGIGVGAGSNIVPMYISELAPPAIRGRLVGIYELGWQVGGLIGFWINYGVDTTMPPSHKQWLIPFAVQLIPSGLLFIGAFFLRESPRWLLLRGRRAEALAALSWLRKLPASDAYVRQEVAMVDAALAAQRARVGGLGFWQPFRAAARSRRVQYRLLLGSLLFLWQNGCGINAINYYSPTVFRSVGVRGANTSLLTTGLYGVVKMVCTVVWLLCLVDRVGRRNLLLVGAAGGSVCLWIIGAYIKLAQPERHPKAHVDAGGTAAVFFFYLWTCFYSMSWNGIPWIINAEMFDPTIRAVAQASAAGSNWLYNFLISRFTPQMFSAMGYGVYFFFAALTVCAFVFVFLLVPESKGIPLESMEMLFDKKPVWRAHALVLEDMAVQGLAVGGEGDDDDDGDVDDAVLAEKQRHVAAKQEGEKEGVASS